MSAGRRAAPGGGADVPVAPIDGADESEVAAVRAVIVEVEVERWVRWEVPVGTARVSVLPAVLHGR